MENELSVPLLIPLSERVARFQAGWGYSIAVGLTVLACFLDVLSTCYWTWGLNIVCLVCLVQMKNRRPEICIILATLVSLVACILQTAAGIYTITSEHTTSIMDAICGDPWTCTTYPEGNGVSGSSCMNDYTCQRWLGSTSVVAGFVWCMVAAFCMWPILNCMAGRRAENAATLSTSRTQSFRFLLLLAGIGFALELVGGGFEGWITNIIGCCCLWKLQRLQKRPKQQNTLWVPEPCESSRSVRLLATVSVCAFLSAGIQGGIGFVQLSWDSAYPRSRQEYRRTHPPYCSLVKDDRYADYNCKDVLAGLTMAGAAFWMAVALWTTCILIRSGGQYHSVQADEDDTEYELGGLGAVIVDEDDTETMDDSECSEQGAEKL